MTFEVIGDAFLDTLKVFPFMLIIYILIEILEHRTSLTQNKNILQGSLAPLIGSATGIVPQCGFSVMAAKLYDNLGRSLDYYAVGAEYGADDNAAYFN